MITSKLHGIIDYVTVLIFLLAPSIFSLSPVATTICYILACVHLLMTILTGFSMSIIAVVSFPFHGFIELLVGLILAIVPWFLDHIFIYTDQLFFSVMGVIILLVWLLTTYRSPLKE